MQGRMHSWRQGHVHACDHIKIARRVSSPTETVLRAHTCHTALFTVAHFANGVATPDLKQLGEVVLGSCAA